jgi:hypothetical protein
MECISQKALGKDIAKGSRLDMRGTKTGDNITVQHLINIKRPASELGLATRAAMLPA